MLLGKNLDENVKCYVIAICKNGRIVTKAITLAATSVLVRRTDRNPPAENGGYVRLTSNWAKSLLYQLHFVKRRAAKISVCNFDEIKEQFLTDLKAVVVMEDTLCSTGTTLMLVMFVVVHGLWRKGGQTEYR